MTDETPLDKKPSATTHTTPRIWPAAVILLAYLAPLWFLLGASTMLLNAVGLIICPNVALVLLLIWWLFASRVPVKQRIVGVLLFAAFQAWLFLLQEADGVYMLAISVPVMFTAAVGFLTLTPWLGWPKRRWGALLVMLICTLAFTAMRVEGVYGNLTPQLAWRWTRASDELPAELAETPGANDGKAVLPAELGAGDWPGFRGPERDGRLTGVTFPTDWMNNPPRELWRRGVGQAWSSFAAVGDYVFTQEQRGGDECVVCYRAASGEQVWVNRVAAFFDNNMGAGPRATPTYDHGKLYTFGATGILQCLDASTGSTLWKRDVPEDTGGKTPQWGFAASPLVTQNLVMVFAGRTDGKGVAAYGRESGDLTWCAGKGSAGYCSPHLAEVAGIPQVLMSSSFGIQAITPETGGVLWEHAWDVKMNPRCIQPTLPDANSVLLGTAAGLGTRRLAVTREDSSWNVEEQWTSKRLRPYFNDGVLHEGYYYGYDGNRFVCLDAATGERMWKGGNYGGQVLLAADMGILVVLTEKGSVVLLKATPDEPVEVAELAALSSKTWNHPVIAHGRLLVRNDREAVCFDLGG